MHVKKCMLVSTGNTYILPVLNKYFTSLTHKHAFFRGPLENQMFDGWLPSRVVGRVDKLTVHRQYLPMLVWCDVGSGMVQ